MSNHRQPIDLSDWDKGLPDFVEENAVFKRDLFFAALLILGFVLGAVVAIKLRLF